MLDISVAGFYVRLYHFFEILLDIVDMWPAHYEDAGCLCWQVIQHSNNLFPVALRFALIKCVNYNEASLISLTTYSEDLTKL